MHGLSILVIILDLRVYHAVALAVGNNASPTGSYPGFRLDNIRVGQPFSSSNAFISSPSKPFNFEQNDNDVGIENRYANVFNKADIASNGRHRAPSGRRSTFNRPYNTGIGRVGGDIDFDAEGRYNNALRDVVGSSPKLGFDNSFGNSPRSIPANSNTYNSGMPTTVTGSGPTYTSVARDGYTNVDKHLDDLHFGFKSEDFGKNNLAPHPAGNNYGAGVSSPSIYPFGNQHTRSSHPLSNGNVPNDKIFGGQQPGSHMLGYPRAIASGNGASVGAYDSGTVRPGVGPYSTGVNPGRYRVPFTDNVRAAKKLPYSRARHSDPGVASHHNRNGNSYVDVPSRRRAPYPLDGQQRPNNDYRRQYPDRSTYGRTQGTGPIQYKINNDYNTKPTAYPDKATYDRKGAGPTQYRVNNDYKTKPTSYPDKSMYGRTQGAGPTQYRVNNDYKTKPTSYPDKSMYGRTQGAGPTQYRVNNDYKTKPTSYPDKSMNGRTRGAGPTQDKVNNDYNTKPTAYPDKSTYGIHQIQEKISNKPHPSSNSYLPQRNPGPYIPNANSYRKAAGSNSPKFLGKSHTGTRPIHPNRKPYNEPNTYSKQNSYTPKNEHRSNQHHPYNGQHGVYSNNNYHVPNQKPYSPANSYTNRKVSVSGKDYANSNDDKSNRHATTNYPKFSQHDKVHEDVPKSSPFTPTSNPPTRDLYNSKNPYTLHFSTNGRKAELTNNPYDIKPVPKYSNSHPEERASKGGSTYPVANLPKSINSYPSEHIPKSGNSYSEVNLPNFRNSYPGANFAKSSNSYPGANLAQSSNSYPGANLAKSSNSYPGTNLAKLSNSYPGTNLEKSINSYPSAKLAKSSNSIPGANLAKFSNSYPGANIAKSSNSYPGVNFSKASMSGENAPKPSNPYSSKLSQRSSNSYPGANIAKSSNSYPVEHFPKSSNVYPGDYFPKSSNSYSGSNLPKSRNSHHGERNPKSSNSYRKQQYPKYSNPNSGYPNAHYSNDNNHKANDYL